MSDWGRATYGDPCSGCGFTWSVALGGAITVVADAPAAFRSVLPGADGSERHPDLLWPVVGYVCHVADNLRIWAERLAGLAAGDRRPVGRYDQDLLAEARRYPEVSLSGALWSLDRAARDWISAVVLADGVGITLVHPDRGEQPLLDVARANAHDVRHHCRDVAITMKDARHRRG
jgi:hypothetical protein